MIVASGHPPLKLLVIFIAIISYSLAVRALITGSVATRGIPVRVYRSEKPAWFWFHVIFLALAPWWVWGWLFVGPWVFWTWFVTGLIAFVIVASIEPWKRPRRRLPPYQGPSVDGDVIKLHDDDLTQDQNGVIPRQDQNGVFHRQPMSWQRVGATAIKVLLYCLIPHVWVGLFLIAMVIWEPVLNCFGHDSNAVIVKRKIINGRHGPSVDVVYQYRDGGRWYTDGQLFHPPASDLQVGSSIQVRSLQWHGHAGSRVLRPSDASSDGFSYVMLVVAAVFWNGIVLLFLIVWLSYKPTPPGRAASPVYRYR